MLRFWQQRWCRDNCEPNLEQKSWQAWQLVWISGFHSLQFCSKIDIFQWTFCSTLLDISHHIWTEVGMRSEIMLKQIRIEMLKLSKKKWKTHKSFKHRFSKENSNISSRNISAVGFRKAWKIWVNIFGVYSALKLLYR